jgi:MFS transporter, DHA2 family, multidrug resistance protein
LLMNLVCATTGNPYLTVGASLLLGCCKILALGQIYLAWSLIWSEKAEAARVYPFFYFVALAGLYFMTWLTTYISYLYSWRYTYIAIGVLLIVCIVLAVIFIENHKLRKIIPLYQLDIPGLLLLLASLMLADYIAAYGKVEDWFESEGICAATFASIVSMLLFIKRGLTLKRPILDFNLFKNVNVSVGLFLFFALGVLTPSIFQSVLASNILHFEGIRNAELNLFLIPGLIAGSVLTFFWYRKKLDSYPLFILGFGAFVIYHIMMYTRFVNDLNITDFLIPSFFKGFALAILYISVGLYTTANLQIPQTLKVVGLILIVRSFLGPGLISGLYNYFLYADTNRHLSTLAAQVDANELMIFQDSNFAEYLKYMLQQATLAALKEITGGVIAFGLLITFLMVVIFTYRKIKERLLPTS